MTDAVPTIRSLNGVAIADFYIGGDVDGVDSSDDESDNLVRRSCSVRRDSLEPTVGRAPRREVGTEALGSALLERCEAAVAASAAGEGVPAAAKGNAAEEGEGVFEIRDFTTASTFERVVHQVALALKSWYGTLQGKALGLGVELDSRTRRFEFDTDGLNYSLFLQAPSLVSDAGAEPCLANPDRPALSTGACHSSILPSFSGAHSERLGLHSFPLRAHRLERWFGVQHFMTVGVKDRAIDLNSARTVLSALVLAARQTQMPQPLACFVPVEGGRGRNRRFTGELVGPGWRTIYNTDQRDSVDPKLEHLAGLLEFFWRKLAVDPEAPGYSLAIGARFLYNADVFDPVEFVGAGSGFCVPKPYDNSARPRADDGEGSQRTAPDPVECLQLHCLWPSFPRGSFVDNEIYSELEPRSAPYWRLRVIRNLETPLPFAQRLRNLLEFRAEARGVRSAECSVQPQMPKSTLASLSYAIKESLESILLPTEGEMIDFTERCMASPVFLRRDENTKAAPGLAATPFAEFRGSVRGTRLAVIARIAADMKCFKGALMLWCQVLQRMRLQWDRLEALDCKAPETCRASSKHTRAESFGPSVCLAQQKFEMFHRSVEATKSGPVAFAPPEPTIGLFVLGTGERISTPQLLPPMLMTDDMALQRKIASTAMSDPVEIAELSGREFRSDLASFKSANPSALLQDFLAWRGQIEGLNAELYPLDWLDRCWEEVRAQPAAKQPRQLFEPEREIEMALHYLENIEGTQFLYQLVRVLLYATLEELGSDPIIQDGRSPYLSMLHDRARSVLQGVFDASSDNDHSVGHGATEADAKAVVMGDTNEIPDEDQIQAAVTAVETLESMLRLSASLRAKLPGDVVDTLLEDLVAESEVAITTERQKLAVENLFVRSRFLSRAPGGRREVSAAAPGIFQSLPWSKEFIFLLQPTDTSTACAGRSSGGGVKRMYSELREKYFRLAIARDIWLA